MLQNTENVKKRVKTQQIIFMKLSTSCCALKKMDSWIVCDGNNWVRGKALITLEHVKRVKSDHLQNWLWNEKGKDNHRLWDGWWLVMKLERRFYCCTLKCQRTFKSEVLNFVLWLLISLINCLLLFGGVPATAAIYSIVSKSIRARMIVSIGESGIMFCFENVQILVGY